MKITYEGNIIKVEDVQEKVKIIDLLNGNKDKKYIACMFNNEVKPLDYKIDKNATIELLDISSKDGMRVYVRGVLYVMSKAFAEVYPEALLTVNYQLAHAMFCEIDNMEVTEEIIDKVRKKMEEIIKNDIAINKISMTREEAEEFYKKEKSLKGLLQLDQKMKKVVSLYYCEDYYNYFYGVMPISTGYINLYDLRKYKDGFLIRYPSKKNTNVMPKFEENKKLLSTLKEYDSIHKTLNINTIYKLNKSIEEDRIKEVILMDEALHEKKIAQIADNIIKRKGTKVILIAGPSSSGKTTFARRLGIQLKLNGLKPVTLSVDNYFVEREENPKDENGEYDFECIEAIDLDLFNDHLTKLLNGEEVNMPKFDFKNGTKIFDGTKLKLAEDEVLVIEGIHCLNDKLTSSIPKENKYKIYISALTVLNLDYYNRISTTDTRLIRRIVRDYKFRGYEAVHTLSMWPSVNRGEENYIFKYQEEADTMFNSSLIYELAVLKEYAIPLLEKIDDTKKEYAESKRILEFLKYFESIPQELVPKNSLLREFLGDGDFDVH